MNYLGGCHWDEETRSVVPHSGSDEGGSEKSGLEMSESEARHYLEVMEAAAIIDARHLREAREFWMANGRQGPEPRMGSL
jgi:hypothetical protein